MKTEKTYPLLLMGKLAMELKLLFDGWNWGEGIEEMLLLLFSVVLLVKTLLLLELVTQIELLLVAISLARSDELRVFVFAVVTTEREFLSNGDEFVLLFLFNVLLLLLLLEPSSNGDGELFKFGVVFPLARSGESIDLENGEEVMEGCVGQEECDWGKLFKELEGVGVDWVVVVFTPQTVVTMESAPTDPSLPPTHSLSMGGTMY